MCEQTVVKNGYKYYLVSTVDLKRAIKKTAKMPCHELYETAVFRCNKSGDVSNWNALEQRQSIHKVDAMNVHKQMIEIFATEGDR